MSQHFLCISGEPFNPRTSTAIHQYLAFEPNCSSNLEGLLGLCRLTEDSGTAIFGLEAGGKFGLDPKRGVGGCLGICSGLGLTLSTALSNVE